jgi:hypothetical protein
MHPPAHVRELLGERPTTDATLTHAWQQLAIGLERHRLQHGIDVDAHGSLGPSPTDPAVRATIAYRHDRDQLARDIARLRHQRGLGLHPEIPDPRTRRAPDHAPDPGR